MKNTLSIHCSLESSTQARFNEIFFSNDKHCVFLQIVLQSERHILGQCLCVCVHVYFFVSLYFPTRARKRQRKRDKFACVKQLGGNLIVFFTVPDLKNQATYSFLGFNFCELPYVIVPSRNHSSLNGKKEKLKGHIHTRAQNIYEQF